MNACQALAGSAIVAIGAYIVRYFAVPSGAPISGRARLVPLLQSADGWPGIAFGCLVMATFGWWSIRAGWRFSAKRPAAAIDGRDLVLHPSYLKKRRIALASLNESALIPEAKVLAWTIHALRLRWTDPEGRQHQAKIRSNTVEGGRDALGAFAEAINRSRGQKALKIDA